MRTKLYKYMDSEKIKTFEEMREDYAQEVGANLPIPDDEMELILILKFVKNGGNIILIEDEVLNWCNDYANVKEADRYLSKEERNNSVRDIYCNIIAKGIFLDNLMEDLRIEKECELYEKLKKLL